MKQLIKQVVKSFKSSILMILGLCFIVFSIVFSSISASYLSSNVQNSYNNLNSKSLPEDSIVELNSSNLKNNTSQSTLYDLNLDFSLNSSDIKKPNQGLYFSNYQEYENYKESFIYQPASLSHFVFELNPDVNNYIFAYYIDSTNDNSYFNDVNINDKRHLFERRANGILKSYGEVAIPSDHTKWRADALLLLPQYDTQKIVYSIDPLTGLTKNMNDDGIVESFGFFSDGLYEDNYVVSAGNKKYPTNVQKISNSENNILPNTNYQIVLESSGKQIDTPFFRTLENWNTDISFDLSQYSLQTIIELIKNGADPINIFSSLYTSVSANIPLGEIDWNIANINPFYDYIKIFHSVNYLTNKKIVGFANDSEVQKNKNDLIFNVHIDESKLSDLQKNTLKFLYENDREKYNELIRFTYVINTSWIYEKIQSIAPNIDISHLNFDNLNDLNTPINIGKNKTTSGIEIINDWLFKYASKQEDLFNEKMIEYEKIYLSSQLNNDETTTFNIQKSFTITDSESSNIYLISQKDSDLSNITPNGDVNKLVVTHGTKLVNSSKYLDIIDTLLSPTRIENAIIPPNSENYSKNKEGIYLINLVEFINNSDITAIPENDYYYERQKHLANKIMSDYHRNRSINPNDYYELLSIVNPVLSTNNKSLFKLNTQDIEMNIVVKNGITSAVFLGTIKYATPYGHATIVTNKWLRDNNKEYVSSDEWKNALDLKGKDFSNWKKNLDSKNKVRVNSIEYIIIGVGESSENSFPIVSIDKPIPNSKTEGLLYLNSQGFDSLLATQPSTYVDEYFAIRRLDKSSLSNHLNNVKQILDNYVHKGAYLASDLNNNKNLLTLRYSFPIVVNNYVYIFTTIFVVLLIAIGIYLYYLMVRMYIDKNQTSLAIIKANGLSNIKIAICLSLFGLLVSVIAGFLGYIAGYLLQDIFLQIIGNYWFLPIYKHSFSILGFFGSAIVVYLIFIIFVYLSILILFKESLNSLISKNVDIKINKMLYIFKNSKLKMPIIPKFVTSLMINKIGKFALLISMCSLGLSVISIGAITPAKFAISENATNQNRHYAYDFELNTPTEQSGLYKIQKQNHLGITNSEIGIESLYEGFSLSTRIGIADPYYKIWNETDFSQPNNKDLFALRNLDGSIKEYGPNKEKRYFGNLILPSYTIYFYIDDDIDLFRNAVFTKWLLDFDINVASISVNAWDLVQQSLPPELVARINSINDEFLDAMLSIPELKKANEIGSGTDANPKPFLSKINDEYILNSDNVLTELDIADLHSIRLNNSFLKFIGMIYGNDELSMLDTKITYGIVPFNEYMETYTYVDSTISNKEIHIPFWFNNGQSELVDIPVKIKGIKTNSKFITLIDDDNENINVLLENKTKDGNIPIIINKSAQLKYGLEIGMKFSILPKNTYDRYTNNLFDLKANSSYMGEIVGISSDSFNASFFTSQDFANEMLGMNFEDGAFIIADMFRKKTIGSNNEEFNENWLIAYGGEQKLLVSSDKLKIKIEPNSSEYKPFNGILSNELEPTLLTNIVLQSNSGMWGNYVDFVSRSFEQLAKSTTPELIFNFILSTNIETLNKIKEQFVLNNFDYNWTDNIRIDIINIMCDLFPYNDINLWDYLENSFGKNIITSAVTNPEFFKTIFNTYTTIFNSFLVIQNLIIVILIPIIIMIVLIISSVMINEFRRILAILKTMGYTDKTAFNIILVSFVPVLIVSLLIGLLILFVFIYSIQTGVFNLSSIFLSTNIEFLPYFYGAISISTILVINLIYVYIYMKKQNLKNAIA